MINAIIDYSVRNRFLVLFGVGALAIAGLWSFQNTPVDAVPDLSDTQVIIFAKWPGQSPGVIEDQITYPVSSVFLAAPKVKFVRGKSMFSMAFIYVIFEDGTDIYWARSRVLEYLSQVQDKLPADAEIRLGPDATGVGWVYQYALVDKSGRNSLADLRTYQDWYLKYALESVPGVSEVASVGGYERQYQVDIDPNKLIAFGISMKGVIGKIRDSNRDVGGGAIELSGTEYIIRGKGYIKNLDDLRMVSLGVDENDAPLYLKDVAHIHEGPAPRRGVAEFNGEGETVGGIVVMRFGENAYEVIERVRKRVEELRPSFPEGIELIEVYDRRNLIEKALATLYEKLIEEGLIIGLICLAFLFSFRAAMTPFLLLPLSILISFIFFRELGLTSNIMSLGGIAIAMGAMVDAAIVLVENVQKHLDRVGDKISKAEKIALVARAAKEVGRPLFFGLLIITVSFIPIFALEAQEGRLFHPLAWTKTLAMAVASFLSITFAPAFMILTMKKSRPEDQNPIVRFLKSWYLPSLGWALAKENRLRVVSGFLILLGLGVLSYTRLGGEFMPPLNEGSLLYMPTAVPGMSINEATRILQVQDRIIKSVPEVKTVFGKAGRANSATDPAPMSMFETVIEFKPESEWRDGMTWEKLKAEIKEKVNTPGMTPIFWMPIQTRTEMLQSGIRSELAIKVFGADVKTIEKVSTDIEKALAALPHTESVYADRLTGGHYIDFEVDRFEVARNGITVGDVQDVIRSALGGMRVSQIVMGRERYDIFVRYERQYRENLEKLARVLVMTPKGPLPLSLFTEMKYLEGPHEYRSESGSLVGFVTIVTKNIDPEGYVEEAAPVLAGVDIPAGYRTEWAGQYTHIIRMKKRLMTVVPLALFIIIILLYFNFRTLRPIALTLLIIPFASAGIFIFLWMLDLWIMDFNMSVAVWAGIIALLGLAAEIGVIKIIYIAEEKEKLMKQKKRFSETDLLLAIKTGAGERIRPITMTLLVLFGGLLPIMLSSAIGADVMQRIAAPMIGGVISAGLASMYLLPILYFYFYRGDCKR